ncbi:low molecular weight phosphatase family protein [Candidatus Puniceispirillum sp.]|nr:low molecular weight phosphatase family protein [Candidatus Puniceispirillum sp.]
MTIEFSNADNSLLAKKGIGAILFACNLNAVRSAMAEAMIKATYPGKIFADSCGVSPGNPDGFAIAVMEEIGINLNTHQPKSFDDLDSAFYDVIISFSPEAHEAAVALTQSMDCETLYWPVDNLANLTGSRVERLRAYRNVRDVIQANLEHYLGKPIAVKT